MVNGTLLNIGDAAILDTGNLVDDGVIVLIEDISHKYYLNEVWYVVSRLNGKMFNFLGSLRPTIRVESSEVIPF